MRILSLCPAATELVCSLGASHLLVGRTDACDYPDAARSIPSIGKPDEVTVEQVAIFEPDLVLVCAGQERIVPPPDARWSVLRVEPETLEDMYALITSLGAMLSKQVEADMLAHDIRSALERVHEACARFRTTRVYSERAGHPSGVPTFVREMIAVAGGDAYTGMPEIEPLLAFNPQMILALAPCEDEHYIELVVSREGWGALQAVRTERLFVLDERLFRPTARLTQGAKLLAKVLHGVMMNGP
jgi:iron complex transport system substrate-binding protein